MEYIVGVTLALLVCGAASWLKMDRDRVFYPSMVITVATYYVAFAVIDGRNEVMLVEAGIAALFAVMAVAGFKRNLWLVAAALAGHGVMDAFHGLLVQNAGVPATWPGFCGAFDVTAGLYVAGLLVLRVNEARGPFRALRPARQSTSPPA